MTDWRLPENRVEAFLRFYSFHLEHRSHPGMVYSLLPAVADAFHLDDDGRAWLAWLNGNTQNVVTSMMLLEVAPTHHDWQKAVQFWDDNFSLLEWDTDRRHQKNKFGQATEDWYMNHGYHPAEDWYMSAQIGGWKAVWQLAKSMPHWGRLSAWSGLEYHRILLGNAIPDVGSWMLDDKAGSRSHRNGIALLAGYDSTHWGEGDAHLLGIVGELEELADALLAKARARNSLEWDCYACESTGCDHCRGIGQWGEPHPDVSRLTMESALCTYKSWHKPNRRYPNVYADMMYSRIKKAEARFGRTFDLLWATRRNDLPEYLRLEDNPRDPGLSVIKQNHYRTTGEIILLHHMFDDMEPSLYDNALAAGEFPMRRDPKWV